MRPDSSGMHDVVRRGGAENIARETDDHAFSVLCHHAQ